jgi:hypothetical protein
MDTPELSAVELARLVKAYTLGHDDGAIEPHGPLSADDAALLTLLRNARMAELCRTSAGLLPFDDTATPALASPYWLRRLQERT